MKIKPGTLALSLAAAALFASDADGQTVRGRVVDAEGTAVPAAAVTVHASSEKEPLKVLADERGRFTARLRRGGEARLEVEALGYAPARTEAVKVGNDEVVELTIELSTQPVPVAAIEVTARSRQDLQSPGMAGFQERRDWGERLGLGRFLTAEQDARLQNAARLTHVLSSMAGLRLQSHPRLMGEYVVTTQGGSCPVVFYLDGVEMRNLSDTPIDNLILPAEIGAIEVYRRPSELPAEFSGSNSRCGVVAIWTSRR